MSKEGAASKNVGLDKPIRRVRQAPGVPMAQRAMRRVTRFCVARDRVVALLWLAFAAWGAYHARSLSPNRTLDPMLPARSGALEETRRLEALFGAAHPLFALIESRVPGQHEFEIKSIAELFAQIATDPRYVESAAFRVDRVHQSYHLDPAAPEFVSFMTAEDWDNIAAQLQPEALERAVGQFRALAGASDRARQRRAEDPLGLFGPIRQRVLASISPLSIPSASRDGYFLSNNRQTLAIAIRPRGRAEDTRFCLELIRHLEAAAAAALNTSHLQRSYSIRLIGPHADAARETRQFAYDAARGLGVWGVFLVAFLLAAFRRAAALAIIGATWAMGLAAMTGGAQWAWGSISAFGLSGLLMSFAALCVFSVHLYSRHVEEATDGALFLPCAETAATTAGVSNLKLLAGAEVLSALAFLGDAGAWREFATTATAGLAIAWLAAHTLQPALCGLLVARRASRVVSRRLTNFGLRYFANAAILLPHLMTALAVMAACYLSFHAARVRVAGGDSWGPARSTRPFEFAAAAGGIRVPTARALLRVDAPDARALAEATDALYQSLRREGAGLNISSIVTLRSFLPARSAQEESRRRALRLDLPALEAKLRQLCQDANLNYDQVFAASIQALKGLAEASTAAGYVEWGSLSGGRYAKLIRDLVRRPGDGALSSITEVYLDSSDPSRDLAALKSTAERVAPGVVVAGGAYVAAEARLRASRTSAKYLLLGAPLAIALCVLLYGGAPWSPVILAPLAVSFVSALGVLSLGGYSLGFAELFLLPTLALLGFAAAAHQVDRFRECRPGADQITVLEANVDYLPHQKACLFSAVHAGRPTAIAALTLFFAFAAMIPAESVALRRVGLAGALGLAASQLFAQTLLPALLALSETGLWANLPRPRGFLERLRKRLRGMKTGSRRGVGADSGLLHRR